MGKKGELSPIDPTLNNITGAAGVPSAVGVEDVSSYVSFMREAVGINDQAALAQVIGLLASHLTPLTLGTVNRQYSHIRLVARKLLAARNVEIPEAKIEAIIGTLTERMYSHGHAIGRKEAKELGLPVQNARVKEEELLWKLYESYEHWLKPEEPIDSESLLLTQNAEEATQANVPFATIESVGRWDVYEGSVIHRRKRLVPPNPKLQINVNLVLPTDMPLYSIPANIQQLLQQMVNQVTQAAPGIVQQQLLLQSPPVGFECRMFGGKWLNRTAQNAEADA